MSELELGEATIVYEDPEDGVIETTLENEQVMYIRDHWAIRAGTDDEGNDLMRQIPDQRVYYVERNVEEFEEEASTVKHRLESIADDLREKLPVATEPPSGREESKRIDIDESAETQSQS